MRILHSLAPGDFGGLEEVVIRLATGLHARGEDVHVAVVMTENRSGHPLVEALQAAGVTVHPLVPGQRGYRAEVDGMRSLANRLEPHVLHTHGYRPGVLHPWATRGLATALVTTLHGFTGGGVKNRLYEWIQLRSARRYQAVIAVSSAMLSRLRRAGIQPDRTHVVPNAWAPRQEPLGGPEARAALGVPAGRPHVGWVGRLSHEKGPDVILEACRALGGLDLVVSIVGDGKMRPTLEAAASGLSGVDVRFHGAVPSAARLLGAFDLLVLSSRTEGTPIVLFEAMEAQVPIVASRVGGVPQVIDREIGILVPSEDPGALADAIKSVLQDPEAAARRAALARHHLADRYGIEDWLDRHQALYSSLNA